MSAEFEWQRDERLTRVGVSLTLYLMRWRSMTRVMNALLAKYPDEDSFDTLLQSPKYIELVGEVAAIVSELQQIMEEFEGDDQRELFASLAAEYPRILEAVGEFAELLGVSPAEQGVTVFAFMLWTAIAFVCSAAASGICAEMLKSAAKNERFLATVAWIVATAILHYVSVLCRLSLAVLWVVFLLQQVKVL
jgi:hypothetical protein